MASGFTIGYSGNICNARRQFYGHSRGCTLHWCDRYIDCICSDVDEKSYGGCWSSEDQHLVVWCDFIGIVFCIYIRVDWITEWPTLPEGDVGDTVLILGKSLVDPSKYVVPFEIASVLLIVALIGSIAVALPSKESE